MPRQIRTIKLDKELDELVEHQARDLGTTRTWVISTAIQQFFGDKLLQTYPNYKMGMPRKDWGKPK